MLAALSLRIILNSFHGAAQWPTSKAKKKVNRIHKNNVNSSWAINHFAWLSHAALLFCFFGHMLNRSVFALVWGVTHTHTFIFLSCFLTSSAMFFCFFTCFSDNQYCCTCWSLTMRYAQTIRTSICIFLINKSLTGNLPLHLAARSPFPATSNKWRGKEREKCVGQDSHSWPADGHFGMSAVGNVRHVCPSSDKGGSISWDAHQLFIGTRTFSLSLLFENLKKKSEPK